ncbi:MAG: TonB-dependent receptor [Corticimicrobacter sp.]|uniref:TonB-dependent receptor n=1 Tax=Corticimicrobacter sp. TaxID=2678536 RepID=UPI0032DACB09
MKHPKQNPGLGLRRNACLAAAIAATLPLSTIAADAPDHPVTTLPRIHIEDDAFSGDLINQGGRVNTVTHITEEGLKLLGSPAQSNPWTALKMAPSVNFQSADAYGLGRPVSMRLRGKSSTHIGRTVEGLPIAGEPGFASGKGGGDLFDMENMSGVSLMRGAIPADRGLGFSNSGVVDMTLRGPEQEAGMQFSQSFGSDNFRRTYVRLDSGALNIPVRAFISMSDTHADKWRGPGDQNRQNVEAGLAFDISPRIKAEIFAVHHEVKWHDYRSLTYDQVSSGATYDSIEYSDRLTGNPASDALYYGFNRQNYTNNAILGKLTVQTSDSSRLLFKPYYWREKGWSLAGNASNGNVTLWDIKHDTYGFDLRHETEQSWGQWVVGYWYQSSEAPPPPTAQRQYRIQPDGSLQFRQWSTLAETTRHRFDNPYASVTYQLGDLRAHAGVRYMSYKDPSFTYYKGNTAPDVSYDDVFGYNPERDPDKYSVGRRIHSWLPNFGLAWTPTAEWTFSANYGRTYGRQNWGSVSGAFSDANRPAFEAAGITFNDIWNGLRPELSDNIDLGARYDFASGYVATTLYQTRYKHKQLSLYDPYIINPDTGKGVTYHQSVAKATGRGIELEMGLTPARDLDLYLSYAYNDASYDDDAQTAGNRIVNVKGKQMQDSPRHIASLNAYWHPDNWTLMAGLRYIGSRFGDTEEKEKVAAYTVVDLGVGYTLPSTLGLRDLSLNLTVSNLFDKRYIGIIGTSDYAVGGGTSYMPGAPRTIAFNLSGRF